MLHAACAFVSGTRELPGIVGSGVPRTSGAGVAVFQGGVGVFHFLSPE